MKELYIMIKFWEREGTKNNKLLGLLKAYDPDQRYFEYGVLNEDIIKSNIDDEKTNIFIISALNNNEHPSGQLQDYPWEQEIFCISKAIDFGWPIYVDFTWEMFFPKYFEESSNLSQEWYDLIFKSCDTKIICPPNFALEQKKIFKEQGVEENLLFVNDDNLSKYLNITKHFELFQFNMRNIGSFRNRHYHLNTYPVPFKEKKYFMSMFIGDIYKMANGYCLSCFKRNEALASSSVYSALLGDHKPNIVMYEDAINKTRERLEEGDYKGLEDKIIFFLNNQHLILENAPFERYDDMNFTENFMHNRIPDVFQERRVPQVAHESHLYMAKETTAQLGDVFYTEKTWKPIMQGFPFIINGPPLSNTLLKQFGYEIFDEIIDYSFDNDIAYYNKTQDTHNHQILYQEKLFDEIDRLFKEGTEMFKLPSVKEKIEHNKYLFYKNTTTESLVNTINELFEVT